MNNFILHKQDSGTRCYCKLTCQWKGKWLYKSDSVHCNKSCSYGLRRKPCKTRPLNSHDLVVRHTILALISRLLAHLTISHNFAEILWYTLQSTVAKCHVIQCKVVFGARMKCTYVTGATPHRNTILHKLESVFYIGTWS